VARLCEHAKLGPALRKLLKHVEPSEVSRLVRDLAGHDMADITNALRTASETLDRPTVLFTYTLKAWGLPTVGHPSNHSALLTDVQWRELAPSLDADPEDPWATFAPDSAEGLTCKSTADRLERASLDSSLRPAVPTTVSGKHPQIASTQQSFGRLLNDLARTEPELATRIVTVSPDVASSTNLGGWINRVGVWHTADPRDWFADDSDTFLHWNESKRGQHIALGIAETNLVGLLGELGATWSRNGEPLIPIGTIYDPFVARALEPWSFGIYGGGRSILIGTPSGISLSREGGAHQSVITPSIGLEQPMCTAWEPCFARDLEWTLLHAMRTLVDPDGTSSYFRLSTKPIDQGLSQEPDNEVALEQRRRQVFAGGYFLRRSPTAPDVVLVATGVVVPETVEASEFLTALGISVDVICVTSADLLFRATRAARGVGPGPSGIVSTLFPWSRRAPIVTVIDGHPHTLAFLGATHGVASTNLGVDRFGEVGDTNDLYRANGIDASTIAGAAFDLLDAQDDPS